MIEHEVICARTTGVGSNVCFTSTISVYKMYTILSPLCVHASAEFPPSIPIYVWLTALRIDHSSLTEPSQTVDYGLGRKFGKKPPASQVKTFVYARGSKSAALATSEDARLCVCF